VLPGGEEIALDRAVIIGRDPSHPDEAPDAHPVTVADPQKTVSKTHVLLTPDPAGVRVRDLHSTNGTTLVLPGGRAPVPAEGGLLVSLPADLELGRYTVRIEC
jgi:pSer/pThr/pTyr-binding forkhead associated (FHA) protein